jgi:hypothetical protein
MALLHDDFMVACLEAGQLLADPGKYPTAPFASLVDYTSRKALILATENQITADVNSVAGKNRAGIVACVRADHSLTVAAVALLDGLPGDVAAGVAMRYYAGFLVVAQDCCTPQICFNIGKLGKENLAFWVT